MAAGRAGGGGARHHPDPGVPLPADRPHRGGGAHRQAGRGEKGAVPLARGGGGDHRGRAGHPRRRAGAVMSKWRRWIAIAVALYLLLVLLDRFVLVELFFRRCGIALGAALLEAFALIGCGFAMRTAVRSSFFVLRSSRSAGKQRTTFPWADLDLTRDLLVGYPIFGALCFLAGSL